MHSILLSGSGWLIQIAFDILWLVKDRSIDTSSLGCQNLQNIFIKKTRVISEGQIQRGLLVHVNMMLFSHVGILLRLIISLMRSLLQGQEMLFCIDCVLGNALVVIGKKYYKSVKFSDTQNVDSNHPKFQTRQSFLRKECQKCADGIIRSSLIDLGVHCMPGSLCPTQFFEN